MFLVDFSIIVIMSKSSESGVDVEVVHLSLPPGTPVKPSLSAGNPDDVTFQES